MDSKPPMIIRLPSNGISMPPNEWPWYVLKVTRFTGLKALRDAKKQRTLSLDTVEPHDDRNSESNTRLRELVRRALRRLSESTRLRFRTFRRERTRLVLSSSDGFRDRTLDRRAQQAAAAILGVSERTIRNAGREAREVLQQELRVDVGDSDSATDADTPASQ